MYNVVDYMVKFFGCPPWCVFHLLLFHYHNGIQLSLSLSPFNSYYSSVSFVSKVYNIGILYKRRWCVTLHLFTTTEMTPCHIHIFIP